MVERFLRYSLERQKKIRAVLLEEDGGLRRANLLVTSIDGDAQGFFAVASGKKKPAHYALSAVLSAGYARGDQGEIEE